MPLVLLFLGAVAVIALASRSEKPVSPPIPMTVKEAFIDEAFKNPGFLASFVAQKQAEQAKKP
jgi:hypothetical protein